MMQTLSVLLGRRGELGGSQNFFAELFRNHLCTTTFDGNPPGRRKREHASACFGVRGAGGRGEGKGREEPPGRGLRKARPGGRSLGK